MLQTDFPAWALWPVFENSFLVIFVAELSLRLVHHGLCGFLFHPEDFMWNTLDFVIVVGGVIDMWLLRLYGWLVGVSFAHTKLLQLIRMLRLLRLVRLMRQLKKIKQLYELALAVVHATQAMGWVLLLTCIFLYIAAIVCTQLIGQGQALPEDIRADLMAFAAADFSESRRLTEDAVANAGSLDPVELRKYFGSIPASMYTLFELIAGWALQPFDTLLDGVPWLKPIFIVFWIFASWALMSVMAGAVSEGMISNKNEEKAEEAAEEVGAKVAFGERIREIAIAADSDGGGTLDWEEFQELSHSAAWRELQDEAGVDHHQITEVFEALLSCQPPGQEESVHRWLLPGNTLNPRWQSMNL
mmetsp:Transcript_3779/g.7961  ORF Transcript_3779/g.7961 Transcript_3779/m.7961 type:complete len:358 (+) Transcript_3779:298-1371(+)